MAGQGHRDPRQHDRPSPADSWPALGPSEAASGFPTEGTTASSSSGLIAPPTRATYRSLILKGLTPEEAANLTAFLCGIPVGTQPWKLTEVNRLLFLRELRQTGRLGLGDEPDPAAAA